MFLFFFFNDTATTEIYTLSLHDALPICAYAVPRATNRRSSKRPCLPYSAPRFHRRRACDRASAPVAHNKRSEEHTSELQSLAYLVCRLLLEKKKNVRHAYVRVG